MTSLLVSEMVGASPTMTLPPMGQALRLKQAT
jgi:hypothetical protein